MTETILLSCEFAQCDVKPKCKELLNVLEYDHSVANSGTEFYLTLSHERRAEDTYAQ